MGTAPHDMQGCQRRFLLSGKSSWEVGAAGYRSAPSAVQGPSGHRYRDIVGTVQFCGDRQGLCSSQDRGCCWDGVPGESGWGSWGLRALAGIFAEDVR